METVWVGILLILLICAFGIIQWIRGWTARDREDPLKTVRRKHPAWFREDLWEDWNSPEDAVYDDFARSAPDPPE